MALNQRQANRKPREMAASMVRDADFNCLFNDLGDGSERDAWSEVPDMQAAQAAYDKYKQSGVLAFSQDEAKTRKRIIAGGGETWVGGVAWSEVPEEYKGPCRVSFSSGSGRLDVEVFPNYCEAHKAARCGVSVEIGGYCEAHITAAVEGETVTHQTHGSWLGE